MRLYYKCLLLLLVVVGLGLPLLIKGPEGRPIMTIADWLPEAGFLRRSSQQLQLVASGLITESAGSMESAQGPTGSLLPAGKMYKWQDKAGGWHFSNQKPQIESQLTVEAMP